MARPDLRKLLGQQKEAVARDKDKVNSLLTNRTSQGFKQDTSTKFEDISGFQDYINPGDDEFKGFDFTSDKEKSRAINQSNWEQAGRAAAKFLPNVSLEIIKQVGNILDVEDYFNTDDEVGNWLSNWADGLKRDVDDHYAIYQENPDTALDFGDFAWWVKNGSSLAESMTAFATVGAVTGGAGLAAFKGGAKALQVLKVLGRGAGTTRGVQGLSTVANAVLLNHAEGMGIATNVYNDIYAQKLEEYKAQGIENADGRAKEDAAKKAVSVVNVNRANILLNLTSASAFLKVPKYARQVRGANSLRQSAKTALIEGGQEALEESVNMIAENQARQANYGLSDIANDVFSAQGFENALLGFVGGAGQTALTNAGRKLKIRRDSEGGRTSDYILKTEAHERQETNKKELEALTKEGKLSDNTDAFLRTREAYALLDDMQDLKEQQKSFNKTSKEYKDIDTKVGNMQSKMLANQAYDAFANGNAEHLLGIFENTAKLTEEEAQAKELPDNYKEKANEAIDYLNTLEKEFDSSQTYINSNNVYQNRSTNAALSKNRKELSKDLANVQSQITTDLAELGIDNPTFEEGKIIIEDYKATPKDVVDNLNSIKSFKSIAEDLDIIKRNQVELAKEYKELTSTQMQEDITKSIKVLRRKEKKEANENVVRQKQEAKKAKKAKTVKTIKEEQAVDKTDTDTSIKPKASPSTSVDPITPTPQAPVESITGESFKSPNEGLDQLTATLNKGYKAAQTTDSKIKGLEKFKSVLTANKGIEGSAGLLAQINREIGKLQKDEANSQARQEKASASNEIIKDKAKTLSSLFKEEEPVPPNNEEDLAPLTEDTKAKIHQQIDALLDLLDSIEDSGVDKDDFNAVAKVVNDALGEEEFASIFEKFEAVYTLAVNKPTSPYLQIFGTSDEKRRVVDSESILKNNRLSNDFYSLTQTEFETNRKNILKEYIESQDYKVYPKDNIKSTDKVKVKTAYNKVAHLDRKYETSIGVNKTDKFNILEFVTAKKDLENTLNSNSSPTLLDYDILNAGSEIEFVVLREQVYDDGTIVTSDGTVIKNGAETSRNPVDVAPIAISFEGEVIPGAFLHTVDWINEANLAFGEDVQVQKDKLRQIRQAVINSTDSRIKTTITKRNDGWLLKDFEGAKSTVKDNLPEVDLAVAKDDVLYNGENSIVTTNNKAVISGIPYAIIPTNKNKQFAIPIQPNKLKNHPEYIDSIVEAIKIYLANNPNDPRVTKVFDSTDLNLTKLSDVKKYVENFIHTIKLEDNTFSGFKDLISSIEDTKSVIRFTGNSIDFGRGLNVGDTTRSINRSNKQEAQVYLEKLRNVLGNNTYIAVDRNKLGTELTLPIITENDVKFSTTSYNDFVKDHTTTDIYGHKLPNGKTIYTIQSSFDFDTSFAFEQEQTQEADQVQITPENTTTSQSNDYDFDLDSDEDFEFDSDLAPNILPPGIIDTFFDNRYKDKAEIDYNLKAVSILNTDKAAQVFAKGKKNNWEIKKILQELQIPKDQIALIENAGFTEIDDILSNLILHNTYEVSVRRTIAGDKYKGVVQAEYETMVADGGVNYAEHSIEVPELNLTGGFHEDILGEHGFMWFRADEETTNTSNRRIMEMQSDLFQGQFDIDQYTKDGIGEPFLELLKNKDKWINFLVKTIVQNSQKKGYNSVSFPKGSIIRKIQGYLPFYTSTKEELEERISTTKVKLADLRQRIIDQDESEDHFTKKELRLNSSPVRPTPKIDSLERSYYSKYYTLKGEKQKLLPTKEEALKHLDKVDAIFNLSLRDFAEFNEISYDGSKDTNDVIKFYSEKILNILNKEFKGKVSEYFDDFGATWTKLDITDIDINTIDLAPKTLTEQQEETFKAQTPKSLVLQGVSFSDQQTIIDHLSANIVKAVNDKKSGQETYTILDEFANTINNVALPLYRDKLEKATESGNTDAIRKFTKQIKRFENISKQYPSIINLALTNVKYNNNVAVDKKSIEIIQQAIEEEDITFDLEAEDGQLKEHNNWESDGVFREDVKTKMSTNVKNMFSYIEDAEYDSKGFTKPKKGLLGIKKTIPFDVVVNEITAILAYNNHTSDSDIVAPDFDSMVAVLEKWADSKPYFHNILERLDSATELEKNEFVALMNKHYTHHTYIYKNEKGKVFANSSDSNTVINVLLGKWYTDMFNSSLVQGVNGKPIINKNVVETIKEDVKNIIPKFKDQSVTLQEVSDLIASMGVELPMDVVKRIMDNGIQYGDKPHSMLSLLNNKDGVFKILLNRLSSIANKSVEEHHPFADNSALRQFARVIAKFNPVYFANSFKDVRGRTYYAYSQNKFLTDRFKDLKTNTALLNQLSNQPYSSTSEWVKELLNPKSNFKKHFGYFTFDGLSTSEDLSRKLDAMSPAEMEESKVALFFSGSRKNKDNYLVKLFYPTTSNKSVQYGMQVKGRDWGNLHPTSKNLSKKQLDALFNSVVMPEILRIKDLQDDPNRHDISGYGEGGTVFNHIPTLNNIQDLWEKDGTVRKLKLDVDTNPTLRHKINAELYRYLNELVDDKLSLWKKYGFSKEINKEDFNEKGEILATKENTLRYTGRDIREEAFNFVLNYLVANVNVYQTFVTDPANFFKSKQYKNVLKRDGLVDELLEAGVIESEEEMSSLKRKDLLNFYKLDDWLNEHEDVFNNIGKRLAADAAPGIDIAEPAGASNRFTVGFIADNEREAYLQQYLDALLGNDSADYRGTASTDAQEFTTLAEHLYIMNKQGKVTQAQANAIMKADASGIKLTKEQKTVLNPLKPVYVNNIWRNGRETRVYIKSSSFPLYKELTKGLELDKLRKAMTSQNVDRIAFDSAVKIGRTTKSNKIYEEGADVAGTLVDNIDLSNRQVLPRKGFKIQQDTPHDPNKDKVNDGTQQRELLTANLKDIGGFKLPNSNDSYTGKEIQSKLDEAYGKVFNIQYNNLVNRLNYDANTGTLDMKSLSKLLQEEATQRGYPLNDIEGLSLKIDEVGELKFTTPLWLLGNSSKIEAMLNSIVDNKVRKIKSKGKSYILGSSEGFKPTITGTEAQEVINNTTGIVWNKEWYSRTDGQLQPMVIKDKNGNIFGTKDFDQASSYVDYAEILIPFKFKDDKGNLLNVKDFITEDGFINTEKMSPELLNVFGFRIPTQYLNSMSAMKIVGFLPEQSGDLVLAPADFTIQMGSDFDVDKLYSNSYHTAYDGNTLTKFTSEEDTVEGLQNEILDLHFAVLSNPDPAVQSKILKPLDFGKLKHNGEDLIDQVYPHTSASTKGRGMTESYQTFKYQNARAGKIGIGVFSNDNTFISSVQEKDIYLQEKVGKVYEEFILTLGGRKGNRISNPNVNTRGSKRTKTDVISAFQSLAVDDENEQGLFKLNINKHTFDAIRSLVMTGFEEDAIIYLINQPIIRRYVELAIDANDSIIPFKESQIFGTLVEEFPAIISEEIEDIPLDIMYKNITKEIVDNDPQRQLYKIFAKMTNFGKSIQTIQSAVNTSSAGIGKNLFYSDIKEQQLLGLTFNSKVANVKNLVGEFLQLRTDIDINKGIKLDTNESEEVNNFLEAALVEWATTSSQEVKTDILNNLKDIGYTTVSAVKSGDVYADNIALIKSNTIRGFASTDALIFNNQLWNKFFPYNTRGIRQALNDLTLIASSTNVATQSIGERANRNDKLFKDIKKFLISGVSTSLVDSDLTTERKRLFIDTKTNMSLGTVLTNIIKEKGLSNEFVNRLQITPRKSVLPTLIKYNASKAENVNELPINTAIVSMLSNDTTDLGTYNGINYTPRKLMQDLIAYQYINGGVQEVNEFIKYVPLSYLNAVNFYNNLDKLDLSNSADFNINNLLNQYVQHNPIKVKLTEQQRAILNTNFKFYDKGTRLRQETTSKVVLPLTFSIDSKNAVSGFRLYSYNYEANEYRQVDTLGTTGLVEFDSTKEFGNSIIPSNQVPVVENPTLPKSDSEIKAFVKLNKPSSDPQTIYDNSALSNVEYFDLTSQASTTERLGFIMTKIADNSDNAFNSIMAKEIAGNLDKLKDFRFIVNNSLQAKGSFNLEAKTIMINPTEINSRLEFEEIILEEVTHALTKEAILANNTGEVARLKGLRNVAEVAVMDYIRRQGNDPNDMFADVVLKLEQGRPLSQFEANVIYPVLNDTEFIGRLFKSKKLQELLNDIPSDVEGKSLLDKVLDFIIDALNAVGLNITKGSALEYGIKDIITLIKQPSPSFDIQGDARKYDPIYRTKEFIENKFDLKREDGTNKTYFNAGEIADWINTNITNLQAIVVNNTVIIEDIIDLAPTTEEGEDFNKANALKKSYLNRIANIQKNIEKTEATQDFDKAEQLKSVLSGLQDRLLEVNSITSLASLHAKGLQDMQEVRDMLNGNVTLEDTLYIRKVIHFWKKGIDLLFDTEDRQSEQLIKLFKEIEAEAEKFNDELKVYEDKYINNLIKQYGSEQTVDNIFEHYKDINGLSSQTLDISRSGNALLDSTFLLVKDANIDAIDSSKEIINTLNDLEAKARPELRKLGTKEPYDIFRQRTKSGKLTGHIVRRFTNDFNRGLNSKLRILSRNNNAVNYIEVLDWAKDNIENVNLNYLIPINPLEGEELSNAQTYREELKSKLGEVHYNEFLAEQSQLINKYNKSLAAKYRNLVGKYDTKSFSEFKDNKEAIKEYQYWIETHSPYEFYKLMNSPFPNRHADTNNFNNPNYVSFLPKGQDGYDSNFRVIEDNQDLKAFYDYYNSVINELKEFLPGDVRRDLAYNGVPYLEKSILDLYRDKGMKIGLTPIWDSIRKSVRSAEESVLIYKNIDPITDKEERSLKISFSKDRSQQIQNELERLTVAYVIENDAQPSTELVTEWRENITNDLAQEQNYDLAKILRVYALTSLAYKHKSKIEDSILLAQNILNNQREINRTGTGKVQYDSATGEVSTKNPEHSFTNTKKQFDAFVANFYGNLKQDQGKTDKKILTKTEKQDKAFIKEQLAELEVLFNDNKITGEEYGRFKNTLEAQLSEMGGYAVWSKRGDNVLKWTQLVKMGWNVMSSVANVGFGFISNYIEAAGGQLYSTKQLTDAYALVGHSVLKNGTFNKFETATAKKIRSIMDNWDVLKDATHELFESPLNIPLGKFEWMNPYNATQRTEYVNQAPLMIAMMMNAKITHNGEEINLWDGYGEDGKWDNETYGDVPMDKVREVVKNLRNKIDQLNKMNHGNYDPISVLGVKSHLLGRAISQFRTWMYEGWAVRTEGYKIDPLLGERKGRYSSAIDFFKEHGTGTTAKAVMKGLARSGTFNILFKNADFEEYNTDNLKDVDIANMRKLMAETLMYVGIYTSYLLLRKLAESLNEDDDDSLAKYTVNTLINQGLRLKTDIIFYLNPAEFKNLMKDLVPSMSIITDAIKFVGSVSDFIQGEDEITTGIHAGSSKLLRDTAKAIPLGSPIYKTINYGAQVFKK
jgi:uncharacterized protein (DUF433 family)